jgi:hypothetical protein
MALEIRPVTDIGAWLAEMRGQGSAPVERPAPPTDEDLEFILGIADRIRMDATAHEDPASSAETRRIRAAIAAGTVDALSWVLARTDVAPASRQPNPRPTPDEMVIESVMADGLRTDGPTGSKSCYYGGVADALSFALGIPCAYWWAPLPTALHRLRPGQDETGRMTG